ncbi:uncharacterized protein [Gossypium hirsutum]|uniref:Uncharacterized protein n=1 Tax=Gossypium hirsutum TaxID=3635 RepID=A0ABM2ZBY5_GOSHI|nr:uncharacterized protein LOC121211494 [Gossypium hirsutum]
MQAPTIETVQPPMGVQQPSRGRGQARGGNGMGRGQRPPNRDAGPIEVRQLVLVYAARRHKDGDANDVIMGTFLILNIPYVALIDIGSTHSYIACSVSETLGIPYEGTSSEISVVTLLGQSIRGGSEGRGGYRDSHGWRTTNYLSNVIFALMVEKLVRKGCKAFLAYINASDSVDLSVKDIRAMKNFPDVFPEELPGLRPSHEVEFGIKLIPSTAPVSIVPYQMALKEIAKLKAQIQELLDRGFICPGVSP